MSRKIKHGHRQRSNTMPEYHIWRAMRQRCQNPNHKLFARYGGRGISVCMRWKSFENFLSDMGPRPNASLTLERSNNDGDYMPGNCVWATRTQQAANRCSNVIVFVDKKPMILAAAIQELGLNKRTVFGRISRGQTVQQALMITE